MSKYNCSIAIQALPNVPSNEERIALIDKVIAHIKSQGYPMLVSPFETVIDGDFDDLMQLIKSFQKVVIDAGAVSVMSYRNLLKTTTLAKKVLKKCSKCSFILNKLRFLAHFCLFFPAFATFFTGSYIKIIYNPDGVLSIDEKIGKYQ